MAGAEPRSAGRPRDESIDVRVLAATHDLLAEVGFDATTVQAIAARSGVHSSAIYRRWSSRTAIIEQAVFPGLDAVNVEPVGDLRKDLRRFIRAYAAALQDPATRAALPALLASYQTEGRDGSAPSWTAVSVRPQFREIVRRAPAGKVDPAVDPDDVFDVLQGALVARALVPTVMHRARPLERLVDLVVRMLRPAPESDRR
jgi:AcrR family transcriptional regulator